MQGPVVKIQVVKLDFFDEMHLGDDLQALAALAFLLAAQDGSARLFRVQKLRQRWDRWTGAEHKLL